MPITRLLVEGIGQNEEEDDNKALDVPIINALLNAGGINNLPLIPVGSKYNLKSAVLSLRKYSKPPFPINSYTVQCDNSIYFIRDRDFDFEVDPAISKPQEIYAEGKQLIGWHWCRHEIENYLLEPALLSSFLNKPLNEIENRIVEAANKIRLYQAARWTVGAIKRPGKLPRLYSLSTRCGKDFYVPFEWGKHECLTWITDMVDYYIEKAGNILNRTAISDFFTMYEDRFSRDKCKDVGWILHIFSGKDIFVALIPLFRVQHPNEIIPQIKKWVVENADEAYSYLDEWNSFVEILKSI